MSATQQHNRLMPPGVVGMDASRQRDARRHRNKRVKQRISSFVMFSVLGGAALGAAYVGYTIYDEQRADEEAERIERQAELEAERANRSTDELIDELSETPRWNGPGSPVFGVGDDDANPITTIKPSSNP